MTSFEKIFEAFSKLGNTKSDGQKITLSQSDEWMKQAGLFNSKFKLTATDTSNAFKKFKVNEMDVKMYIEFLKSLCTEKQLNLEEIKDKLMKCGLPGTDKIAEASKYLK